MRRTNTSTCIVVLSLVLACGDGDGSPLAPTARTTQTGQPDGPPDPLAGRAKAEVCADPSLALIQWDFDQLQQGFHDLCCGNDGLPAESMECTLDWPFSDIPPCTAWAHMRNSIYARYGYPFTSGTWANEFEKTAWYVRRDDFKPDWMSPHAARNIARLQQNEADRVACSR